MAALDRAGVFGPSRLAHGLVTEFAEESRLAGAPLAADIARTYGGRAVNGYRDGDNIEDLVRLDIESGAIEASRLRKETLAAIGASKLSAAGAGVIVDSSSWGAVGIIESLLVARKVVSGFVTARNVLRVSGPGLFIPIDYGYINIKLAREAKRLGWKVLYFVPPGSWRRDKQGQDIPDVTDAVVTPFPWSADLLRAMGADAHFFGHPLKSMVALEPDRPERNGIAVLPGSRSHEVRHNVEAIVGAVAEFEEPIKVAVAANLDPDDVRHQWEVAGGGTAEFRRDTYGVLKEARAAVVCSGTATLEAALCHCPTVVVYRGSPWMELEYRIRRPKFEHISLPNILLGRRVLPELIQWEADPAVITHHLKALLADGPERSAQLGAFGELESLLGPTECFDKTAQLALALMSAG